MGNEQAKLSPEDLRELEDATYFDKRELQKWFREFMKDCPSGVLSKEDFIRFVSRRNSIKGSFSTCSVVGWREKIGVLDCRRRNAACHLTRSFLCYIQNSDFGGGVAKANPPPW